VSGTIPTNEEGSAQVSRIEPCTGQLLWFDVAATDRHPASGLAECSDCGAVFVAGSLLDERHADANVLRVD
jgi:hypothetical protein